MVSKLNVKPQIIGKDLRQYLGVEHTLAKHNHPAKENAPVPNFKEYLEMSRIEDLKKNTHGAPAVVKEDRKASVLPYNINDFLPSNTSSQQPPQINKDLSVLSQFVVVPQMSPYQNPIFI